jgi:fused signal recognition particle receptor
MSTLESIIYHAVVAQAEVPASPAVEYAIYGVIGAFVLFIIVRALGMKPDFESSAQRAKPESVASTRSAEEIEADARRVFEIPHVEVNEEDAESYPQVRIMRTENDSTPTTRDTEKGPGPVSEPSVEAEPVDPHAERAGKTLREGLSRTHDGFVKKLGRLFGGAKTLDDGLLAELEEALFTADIGVKTSQALVDMLHQSLKGKELTDPERVWAQLKTEIRTMLGSDIRPLDLERSRPFVIMVVGVNGAGKTTSIGKLASRFRQDGKSVLLAAGDTFRAAAVEQLEVWAERAEVTVVKGKERQDPSSVIFDACQKAEREGFDVVIADTAGRLQARKELMDELEKVHRVVGKALPGAPHEVWLVLDATNGQNAISQAKEFRAVVDVTGLVLTKLDGTAKGGVVIGICDEMKLPVRFIGIGEKVEDLRPFDPSAFADALLMDG